jgi:hypothetical protein
MMRVVTASHPLPGRFALRCAASARAGKALVNRSVCLVGGFLGYEPSLPASSPRAPIPLTAAVWAAVSGVGGASSRGRHLGSRATGSHSPSRVHAAARPEIGVSCHQSLRILRIVARDDMCGPLRYELGRGTTGLNGRASPGLRGLACLLRFRALLNADPIRGAGITVSVRAACDHRACGPYVLFVP